MNLINEKITSKTIMLIDEEKNNLGNKDVQFGINYAKSLGLDLVQMSSDQIPTCRVMDYNKDRFKKNKSNKGQRPIKTKEIRIKPNITDFDLSTKIRSMERMLSKKHKIKVSIVFKGRELATKEKGFDIIEKIKNSISNIKIDSEPKFEGRSIIMMVS